jgi:peptidoglycan DL-endopeptidase CwlO
MRSRSSGCAFRPASRHRARFTLAVSSSQLQPGDVVFFDGLGHNGIYIGGNQFIHAPHTSDVVKISSISGWYASTYAGARRY